MRSWHNLLSCSFPLQKGDSSKMGNKKQTSKDVASTASKILRDGRYSDAAKKVAGSALSQTKKGK